MPTTLTDSQRWKTIAFIFMDIMIFAISGFFYYKQTNSLSRSFLHHSDNQHGFKIPLHKKIVLYYSFLIACYFFLASSYFAEFFVDYSDPTATYSFLYYLALVLYFSSQSALFSILLIIFCQLHTVITKPSVRTKRINTAMQTVAIIFCAVPIALSVYIAASLCSETVLWDDSTGSGTLVPQQHYITSMNSVNAICTSVPVLCILSIIIGYSCARRQAGRVGMLPSGMTGITRFAVIMLVIYQSINILYLDPQLLDGPNVYIRNNVLYCSGCICFSLIFVDPFAKKSTSSEVLPLTGDDLPDAW
eukprot:gnl/Dysnectes_brevis/9376_a17368_245.p1 GENE.gnl/Dysnectes_brevis/9376_a17368_245~~gnl/Dysnectes_brevis/9376_a17368_245.p1  ORF type:complete len:304 (+),score=3.59 gnl/Dysnectes_brevis/9376_a17368_245:40-951(+)